MTSGNIYEIRILKIFCFRMESRFNDRHSGEKDKRELRGSYESELMQKEDTSSLGLLEDNMSGNEILKQHL